MITSIPLTSLGGSDQCIWGLPSNGTYTVRSAYRLAMETLANMEHLKLKGDWNQLWNANLPSKFKNCLWRACHGCLPTRLNLQRRGITMHSTCVFCSNNLENEWHIFTSCVYAQDCWKQVGLDGLVEACMENVESFREWFFKVMGLLSTFQLGKFAMTIYAIWTQRNNMLWNEECLPASVAISKSISFLYDWLNMRSKRLSGSMVLSLRSDIAPEIWKKLALGFVKCITDVAYFQVDNLVGYGMVLRDDRGKFVAATTKITKGLFGIVAILCFMF
ncbi:hypothetical protein PTKIN_Ptkin05aG0069300 [Pterospermum kingtungense]